MNQKKIGVFLKKLRLEKGLTQEELAEKFYVSNRTVSRWETGVNIPDISLLIELANFYGVDVREIINGEKNTKKSKLEDTLEKVAKYSKLEKESTIIKILDMTVGTLILFTFYILLKIINRFGSIPSKPYYNMEVFVLCMTLISLIVNIIYLSKMKDRRK